MPRSHAFCGVTCCTVCECMCDYVGLWAVAQKQSLRLPCAVPSLKLSKAMRAAPVLLGVAGALLHARRPAPQEQAAPPSPVLPGPRSPGQQRASARAEAQRTRQARRLLACTALSALLSLLLVAAVSLSQPTRVLLPLALASACSAVLALAVAFHSRPRTRRRLPPQPRPAPADCLASSFESLLAQRLAPEQLAVLSTRLTGFWRKDNAASDSMDGPLDLVHVPWLVRQAVNLVVGLELKLDGNEFHFIVCSRIKWFKIREVFSVQGEGRRFQRRDLRGGGATGRSVVTSAGVWLALQWEEPFGGTERSLLSVSDDGRTLQAKSRITLRDGESVTYTTIYRRD